MIRARIVLAVGVLCLLLSAGSTHAQDSDPTTVAKKAMDFLSKQLPKPFPGLDTYTFSSQTFPDGGLGCPAKGVTYSSVQTPGYRFLMTVKGVIYEVHTNLDGSVAVLCDQANIKQNPALNIYRSPQFSIPYPDTWLVTPRDAVEVYFGLGAAQVCAQPGMIVTPLGALPTVKTTDTLLDDYLAANRNQLPNAARESVGSLGRSVTVQGTCTDGSPRDLRISIYVAFGQGYRVVQFAPLAAFTQWADVFKKIAEDFSPSTLGTGGGSGQSVRQPENAPDTLVVHIFGGNVFAAAIGDLPGTPLTRNADLITGTHRYAHPRISPDGKRVLFVDVPDQGLYVAAVEKLPVPKHLPVKLSADDYSPAWSPDGTEIAYVAAESPFTLYALKLADNTNRKLAALDITDCPSTALTDPAAALLKADVGLNGTHLLLDWTTPTTLLLSQECNGLGVWRIDLASGQASLLAPPAQLAQPAQSMAQIAHPHLSPSKALLAGTTGGKLTLFNLANGQSQVLPLDADQIGWSADSSALYYTTRTLKAPLKLDSLVPGFDPFESATYELTLNRYALSGSNAAQSLPLFQGEGYAIGTLAPSPDGRGILFTLIQSDAALLEGVSRKANAGELHRLAPTAQLYWLAVAAGAQPLLLANTLQPSFGPLGSMAVVGLPVAGTKAAKP